MRKLLLVSLFFPVLFYSQLLVRGKVVDESTSSPLAFVSIGIQGTNQGTLSDIDGKFQLSIPANQKAVLIFSYLGYVSKTLTVESKEDLTVKLKRQAFALDEVTIKAKENPAHRIIRNVTNNRENNNPEKMRSFYYVSYNKMYVTADLAEKVDTSFMDTATQSKAKRLLERQHLFLTESVSERRYRHPGKNAEKVLASRVSGFKASPFTMLATQMQSFSFYNDFINVFDKHYLNPVCEGSTKKYFFQIEDTLYQGKDSVFVISFRPLKNKNFDGMKGVLYINTDGWAIQNVIAEPVDRKGMVSIKIQQQYKKIDSLQWFPVQLNTDWIYNNATVQDSTFTVTNTEAQNDNGKIKAIARTYIRDISLNPEIKRKEFSEVELQMTDEADKRNEEFWNKYRVDSLTAKDKTTYQKIDSIGKKEGFDKKLLWIETFSEGKWNYNYIDFDLNRIIRVNDYEGWRPGLGIHTSKKLSKVFNVGGYFAYGFKDKTFKYGGDINFRLSRKKELWFHASYENDVVESAGQQFFENKRILNPIETIRDYYIRKMDRYVKYEASVDFRMLKYFRVNAYYNMQNRWSERGFLAENLPGEFAIADTFDISERGVKVKYVFREKFLETPRAKISLGSDYAIVYFNAAHGLWRMPENTINESTYYRFDLRIDDAFRFRTIGLLNVSVNAGKVIGNVPYTLLYTARPSFYPGFSVSAPNSFETMRMNEFTSSQYVALFLNHNIGRFLKKRKKFNPELELVHNMGIGWLDHPDSHFNVGIKTMEKGYFESGIRLNNLIRSNIVGYGVSAHYRYGPYALPTTKGNIYVRMSLIMSLN